MYLELEKKNFLSKNNENIEFLELFVMVPIPEISMTVKLRLKTNDITAKSIIPGLIAGGQELILHCKYDKYVNDNGDTIDYTVFYVKYDLLGEVMTCNLKPCDTTSKQLLNKLIQPDKEV